MTRPCAGPILAGLRLIWVGSLRPPSERGLSGPCPGFAVLSVLADARPDSRPDQEHSALTFMRKLKVLVLLLSLFSVVAVHMFSWPVQVQAFGHGFANLVGQEHPWTMFSADPRGISL